MDDSSSECRVGQVIRVLLRVPKETRIFLNRKKLARHLLFVVESKSLFLVATLPGAAECGTIRSYPARLHCLQLEAVQDSECQVAVLRPFISGIRAKFRGCLQSKGMA
jgi:hypothetical protein